MRGAPPLRELQLQSSWLLLHSVAKPTRTLYTAQYKSYREFALHYHLQDFPLTEHTLVLFATHLSRRSQSHKSIKRYMAGLNFFAQVLGHTNVFDSAPRLARLIRGIKRYQGQQYSRPQRSPVTPLLLRKMGRNLFRSPMLYEDKLMIWAAMLTAFFGFLRVSEYTSKLVRSHDPTSTLCVQDVTVGLATAELQIKSSKTDPFRQGITMRLAANGSTLCPIRALNQYQQASPRTTGPFFRFADGRNLTRRGFMKVLNMIKPQDVANMSTHSFRIGAATAAAAAGYPRWAIQAMGRWTSDCYRTYIRITNTTIGNMSRAMAFVPVVDFPPFEPDYL